MFVHRSNSLEELVDRLSAVLDEPLPLALEEETVLIQSAGMQRYLSRELARRSGILANTRFPFPRAFLREVLDSSLGEEPRSQAFERECLTWALYRNLHKHRHTKHKTFDSVRRYLADDVDGTKRLLLAERLAHLFDQYVTYRPRMIQNWEQGAHPDEFQAILWRELVKEWGSVHFAARCQRFMDEVESETLRAALPSRVSLMGGPGLPPLFLQMLGRVGQVVPTHIFSFTVCREYFADAHPLAEDDSEVGEGLHPLLVSLGKLGGDYQHLLEMIGSYEDGSEKFRIPRAENVLTLLQRDLVQGRVREPDEDPERTKILEKLGEDDSITVDSTHSRLREVETLHDRLLGWFQQDPDLRPEDVVVLAPNIEEYSPLIAAVFSSRSRANSKDGQVKIPFRIADRSEKYTNAAARALLLGLSLLRSRFKASDVLDLLQLEPVRARYEIDTATLERIARWVSDSGIRWGIDEHHREEFGLPAEDENTWRFGLRRLVLGYALADDGEQLFDEVVPFDDVGAQDAEVLGRLCDYCERLFSLRERLAKTEGEGLLISQWPGFLTELADALVVESSDGAWDVDAVRKSLSHLEERTFEVLRDSDREELRLGLSGMLHLLEKELDESRPNTDFLAGGVTFCALLPLRTIPFRAVCVLGLNQGEFPRTDPHHPLDLIAQDPRRGDRSLRSDDRYLFLEVLLAARERLSLSYVGRSVQDNTNKPPSVILRELKNVVLQVLGEGGGRYLEARVHPLQPFHQDYFRSDGLNARSFDANAYKGALALLKPVEEVSPFFSIGNVDGEPAVESLLEGFNGEIDLRELTRFWKDPSAAYLRARGVVLDDEIHEMEDREPIVESPLSRFIIGDRVLSGLASGKSIRQEIELRRGDLPVGQGGAALLTKVKRVAEEIWSSSCGHRGKHERESLVINLSFSSERSSRFFDLIGEDLWPRVKNSSNWPDEIKLKGVVEPLYGPVRLEMSYGQQTVGRLINLWIEHLAGCVACEESEAPLLKKSILLTRGNPADGEDKEELTLGPVDPQVARKILGDLALLSVLGRLVPLRFFAAASQRYVLSLLKPKRGVADEDKVANAIEAARDALFPKRVFAQPNPSVGEVFRGSDPLGTEELHPDDLSESSFALLAEKLFGPLFAAIEEPTV